MSNEDIRVYTEVELDGEFEFTSNREEIERALPDDAEIDPEQIASDDAREKAQQAAVEAIESEPEKYISVVEVISDE